jgi:hypothetical protein
VAERWVEADEAASLMEETKSVIFSQMVVKLLGENIKLATGKAEVLAKSSDDYKDFIQEMVALRSKANLLKVKMDVLRMKFSEQQSQEANARSERRL